MQDQIILLEVPSLLQVLDIIITYESFANIYNFVGSVNSGVCLPP
jgi:hypothetical protein